VLNLQVLSYEPNTLPLDHCMAHAVIDSEHVCIVAYRLFCMLGFQMDASLSVGD